MQINSRTPDRVGINSYACNWECARARRVFTRRYISLWSRDAAAAVYVNEDIFKNIPCVYTSFTAG